MTTIKMTLGTFPITTFSLLKLEHHTMHGSETWYACVFQHFHDNHEQKWPQALFDQERLLHFSNLQTMKCTEMKLCQHVHFSVSMTTINKKCPWAPFSIHFSTLQTIQCKKMRLVMHMHFSISITTMNQKWPRALFYFFTSQTCKLHNA